MNRPEFTIFDTDGVSDSAPSVRWMVVETDGEEPTRFFPSHAKARAWVQAQGCVFNPHTGAWRRPTP